jgi:hypothetical protein
MTKQFTDSTQANAFFKDINFTSIIDTIKNIYMSDGAMNTLLDYERVLDDADVYAFKNWINGELVQGPEIGRYTCSCSFMWPYKLMPDPKASLRLTAIGCTVKMMKGQLEVPVEVESYEDFQSGSRYPKMKENEVWFMQIAIPFDLEETTSENSTSDDNSAAPDDFDAMSDPMGAPAI